MPLMIDLAESGDPKVLALLRRHPRIRLIQPGTRPGVRFRKGDWHREVKVGDSSAPLKGLAELMDNNPIVCADILSVPSAGATLAMIAIGPLARADLLNETPTMVVNCTSDDREIASFLATEGWNEGVIVHTEELELSGVLAATVMASVKTPEEIGQIDEIYGERFGRSFFVRNDDDSEWSPELVRNKPFALYRLRISLGSPHSLLTIRVLADAAGKCGAAQVVHAMNIMNGFEESLGIA